MGHPFVSDLASESDDEFDAGDDFDEVCFDELVTGYMLMHSCSFNDVGLVSKCGLIVKDFICFSVFAVIICCLPPFNEA